ncbi:type II toxin-antitoxin system RelE family toxin [Crocosphaera sp. XPORK-15E]|uniref:type II toxin-antitoxin system RelE family toxin n=1 Tax=Crocosphaera sp. XPORK-15E TaxID=3110247 RepID=UPI002B1EB300|nr:type II toxin-antitoxin system RelE/ParE family toxin [Crocosphaera sp. XPORK-15E]MEA5534928.1 type II toxin-antitoxin system RelE/ParE family toxin [Crocosphaera sp. XPORK-15E]
MKTQFRKSFEKDLKKIFDQKLLIKIKKVIEEIETVTILGEIKNIKKLKGEDYFYRIRVGEYRLGIKVNDDTVTCVRILHRREIYRFFP